MAEKIIGLLSGLPLEWQIFFLSMIPITELRVTIPYGIAQGMDPLLAMKTAALGNMVIIFPLLLLLRPALDMLSKLPVTDRLIKKILQRTRRKGDAVTKYGVVGLAIFVAVPLPGTGVWTASLLAYLFGIKFLPALLALSAGVIIAAVIVTLVSFGMLDLLGFSLLLVLGIVIGLAAIYHLGSSFWKGRGDKS